MRHAARKLPAVLREMNGSSWEDGGAASTWPDGEAGARGRVLHPHFPVTGPGQHCALDAPASHAARLQPASLSPFGPGRVSFPSSARARGASTGPRLGRLRKTAEGVPDSWL